MNAKASELARIQEVYSLGRKTLADIQKTGFTVERFTHPATISDELMAEGFMSRMFRIVEEASRFPEAFSLYGVPIHELRGLRNILAHAYGDVDTLSIWACLTRDLPGLLVACEQYCDDRGLSLLD